MTTIVGVDFSGARGDRNTWATRAHLTPDGLLIFHSAESIRRDDLSTLLSTIPAPAVVALDFPFGVPRGFANYLSPQRQPADMPALWRTVADMNLEDFIAQRRDYVAQFGEPKRSGDAAHHPESFSPLHAVNPNMLPMTFHGMRMLHRWHETHPARWHVPPLDPPADPAKSVTLLELMPGAFLKTAGLPYKGYKRGNRAPQLRTQIVQGLEEASGVRLSNTNAVIPGSLANDDCLDSVVASVAAASWTLDPARFHHPLPHELADARLEGWIYVPQPWRHSEAR